MTEYQFKGPTLQDKVGELLKQHGYKGPRVQREFNVGFTWYSDVFLRNRYRAGADKLQEIYETLTGEPLIK